MLTEYVPSLDSTCSRLLLDSAFTAKGCDRRFRQPISNACRGDEGRGCSRKKEKRRVGPKGECVLPSSLVMWLCCESYVRVCLTVCMGVCVVLDGSGSAEFSKTEPRTRRAVLRRIRERTRCKRLKQTCIHGTSHLTHVTERNDLTLLIVELCSRRRSRRTS